jgi:hypothetical protein
MSVAFARILAPDVIWDMCPGTETGELAVLISGAVRRKWLRGKRDRVSTT